MITIGELIGVTQKPALTEEEIYKKEFGKEYCPKCQADEIMYRVKHQNYPESEMRIKVYKQFQKKPHRCGKD